MEVEGSAGGVMVLAKVNGKQEVISLKIEPEVLNEDVEMLEDLVLAAINQAMSRSKRSAEEHMKEVTGGLMGNLPDGMKLPFPGI